MIKSRILVVDDEKAMADGIASILNNTGRFEAKVTYCGKEAVEIADKDTFDAVVLDIRMDDMDGLEVLEKIKTIDNNLQVIMLTAFDEGKIGWSSSEKGAFLYLTKPFKNLDLIMEVERAVDVTKLMRSDKAKSELFNSFLNLYHIDSTKFRLCQEKLFEETKRQNKETFTELPTKDFVRILNEFK